jgi:hypothetical protein
MFSVNNFYDYLIHKYARPYENKNFLHHFETHGDCNLYALDSYYYYNSVEFCPLLEQKPTQKKFYGAIYTFDQEPIDFEKLYFGDCNAISEPPTRAREVKLNSFYKKHLSRAEHVMAIISRHTTPIIAHSEKNSNEIEQFKQFGFLDVHYWYHGLIARDWFRHWKHYKPLHNSNNRFGCYIRDMTGSRQYRKQLFKFVKNNGIFCPLLNGQDYNSNASAMLEWNDTGKFDIHIVAETLFHTQKTHLTEKSLKPIAMEQPFILFAGPNSLQYMRDYGFQTFDCCWDESYDAITNSKERYDAIIDLIKHLNSLPTDEYNRILRRAKLIAKNNRDHFYSQRFEDYLLNELHTNFKQALEKQQSPTTTSTFFKSMALIKKRAGKIHPIDIDRTNGIINYLSKHDPEEKDRILEQYPDLF